MAPALAHPAARAPADGGFTITLRPVGAREDADAWPNVLPSGDAERVGGDAVSVMLRIYNPTSAEAAYAYVAPNITQIA